MNRSGARRRTSAALVGVAALGLVVTASPSTASTAAPTGSTPPVGLSSLLGGVSAFDSTWGDVGMRQIAGSLDANGRWQSGRDPGSVRSIVAGAKARLLGSSQPTGKGVTVAVVDTGIAPVRGLDGRGKVVNGPDLSFEGQRASTRHVDGYGHGTHLAGIIAGQDLKADGRTPDPDGFSGVAPDAQLLNMKVGAADGAADVSQVIAAIDWVVAHRKDDGMNVRVLSLAYGTSSTQPWQKDPLAKAVENAWDAGIVVVSAAGNDGVAAPSLLMPALDPRILAVGAVDEKGTATRTDDVVADFSNGGSQTRRPDVLAPGRSVVSLRVPGSYVDTYHPEGRVVGDATGRFFRGSGTSQATAVLAGEVALLLQARPLLDPDQVKQVLRSTADPLAQPRPEMGAGVVDVAEATKALPPLGVGTSSSAKGTGSLEASRGGEHVLDPTNGVVLMGEVDALGSPWNASTWASASTKKSSWHGGAWNGRTWSGTWTGTSWSGIAWSSRTWSSATWTAGAWSGTDWQGRSWREASWLGRSWRDNAWVGRSWRSLP